MITPVGIISYPSLFEPKPNPSGQLKYSCSLLFDKSDLAGIAALNEAVSKAIDKGITSLWKGKKPAFRYNPLRDGDDELKSGEKTDKVYAGKVFINCSSEQAPGVVVATGQGPKPLLDPTAIFAGCFVRADINPFPYSNKGNNGIGWGLNNILLLREGPRLDGRMRATDAFAEYGVEEGETPVDESADLM